MLTICQHFFVWKDFKSVLNLNHYCTLRCTTKRAVCPSLFWGVLITTRCTFPFDSLWLFVHSTIFQLVIKLFKSALVASFHLNKVSEEICNIFKAFFTSFFWTNCPLCGAPQGTVMIQIQDWFKIFSNKKNVDK